MQKNDLLKNYKKQAALREKWMNMWTEFEQQFADLPKWAQEILLSDINTALQNRIIVMQKAQARIKGGATQ